MSSVEAITYVCDTCSRVASVDAPHGASRLPRPLPPGWRHIELSFDDVSPVRWDFCSLECADRTIVATVIDTFRRN